MAVYDISNQRWKKKISEKIIMWNFNFRLWRNRVLFVGKKMYDSLKLNNIQLKEQKTIWFGIYYFYGAEKKCQNENISNENGDSVRTLQEKRVITKPLCLFTRCVRFSFFRFVALSFTLKWCVEVHRHATIKCQARSFQFGWNGRIWMTFLVFYRANTACSRKFDYIYDSKSTNNPLF